MNKRSMAIATTAGVVVASLLLAGCGPKKAPKAGRPTAVATSAASPTPAASATPVVVDLSPGNCTIYTKAAAITLLGAVNMNNKALDINTGGGTKIDLCSYINYKGGQDLEGVSYAVVRYDSPATAFAKAQTVQTDMLGEEGVNSWSVPALATPAPGAGQFLGGYKTKTDSDGFTYTIAVVGTNVGPYLVAALGASTESAGNAKKYALSLFQVLSTAAA